MKRSQQNLAKKVLRFWDFDQQSYQLISDEHNQGVKAGIPWKQGPVPEEFAIYGLGQSKSPFPILPISRDYWKMSLDSKPSIKKEIARY